ncbi:hypothetical protein D1B31_12965 [Neobacillus notoginsengisoli]|uniref:Uncharacterized protein n=1 Tax=Neobacillus notoginsengisoli TaxID=1578198 RepID=A0A417YSC0_9BACI|nr:hypothetical protein [Neobacillus notoginsengisoli]RHW38889.1 hypothetical protein D1B31_12965 [Neobacillus notoginsengisoli]
MKKWLSLLLGLVIILSFNPIASAHQGQSGNQDVLNAAQKFRNGGNGLSDQGNGSKVSGTHNHDGSGSAGGHSHGPVVETPPNMKILGTFGGINLSFIFIGIWNKRFRRNGEKHGNPRKKPPCA